MSGWTVSLKKPILLGHTDVAVVGRQHAIQIWFSVATTINNKVVDFYFLVWSLSGLLCCAAPGSTVAIPLLLFLTVVK